MLSRPTLMRRFFVFVSAARAGWSCTQQEKGKETKRIRVLRAYAKEKRTCPPSPSCSMPFFFCCCCCCFCVFVSLKSASNSSPKLRIESGTPGQFFHAFFFLYLFYDSSSANVRICTQASKQDVNNTQKEAENCQLFSAILLLLYPP